MDAVIVQNISKTFGNTQALKEVSFSIRQGEIFGLIGPDGAGKTTLLRIIISLLQQDSGQVTVFGYDTRTDWRHIRKITGYMPQQFSLYQDLTVRENLEFFAGIFNVNIKDNYDLIKDIYSQLEPFEKRRAGKLSGGMKQKLALSCALIHRPRLLVLDEPSTGIDAISRRQIWQNLQKLKQQGLTIIVTTPYMDEASLCDRVALMQQGKILTIDTPANITAGFDKTLFSITSGNIMNTIRILRQNPHCHYAFTFGQTIHYADRRKNINPQVISDFLTRYGCKNFSVEPLKPTVEDCFINLTTQNTSSENDYPHTCKRAETDAPRPAGSRYVHYDANRANAFSGLCCHFRHKKH